MLGNPFMGGRHPANCLYSLLCRALLPVSHRPFGSRAARPANPSRVARRPYHALTRSTGNDAASWCDPSTPLPSVQRASCLTSRVCPTASPRRMDSGTCASPPLCPNTISIRMFVKMGRARSSAFVHYAGFHCLGAAHSYQYPGHKTGHA